MLKSALAILSFQGCQVREEVRDLLLEAQEKGCAMSAWCRELTGKVHPQPQWCPQQVRGQARRAEVMWPKFQKAEVAG